MLEEALVGYLAANTRVTALIGTPATRRDKTNGIFPAVPPDEVPTPYLVYMKVMGDPMATSFEGTNALSKATYKFSAFGSTYKEAKLLAKAVHHALLDMTVHAVNVPAQVEIDEVWCTDDGQDTVEQLLHATVYQTSVDFQFDYLDMSS